MFVRLLFLTICAWTAIVSSMHTPDGKLFRSDYTFDQQAGGWLKFHPIPKNWKNAALRCYHEGAILASPVNNEMMFALSNFIKDQVADSTVIFTGIGNIYDDNEYQSMEGVPIASIQLNWSEEPSVKYSRKNCLVMNSRRYTIAVSCEDQHAFICYRQKGVSELNKCGTVDLEYIFNPIAGSCYKVSEKALIWSDAYTSCVIDGAHLAIINSQAEAEILGELSKTILPDQSVFLGIRAWYYEWITVQGQSLNDAGYSEWVKGENNVRTNNHCAGIPAGAEIKHGVIDYMSCSEPKHYICEMEPKIEADVDN